MYFDWIKHISPMKYSFAAFMINEYTDLELYCEDDEFVRSQPLYQALGRLRLDEPASEVSGAACPSSGDTTPCRMTSANLQGVVSPDSALAAFGYTDLELYCEDDEFVRPQPLRPCL